MYTTCAHSFYQTKNGESGRKIYCFLGRSGPWRVSTWRMNTWTLTDRSYSTVFHHHSMHCSAPSPPLQEDGLWLRLHSFAAACSKPLPLTALGPINPGPSPQPRSCAAIFPATLSRWGHLTWSQPTSTQPNSVLLDSGCFYCQGWLLGHCFLDQEARLAICMHADQSAPDPELPTLGQVLASWSQVFILNMHAGSWLHPFPQGAVGRKLVLALALSQPLPQSQRVRELGWPQPHLGQSQPQDLNQCTQPSSINLTQWHSTLTLPHSPNLCWNWIC